MSEQGCGGRKLNEKIDIARIPSFVTGNRSENADIFYPESFRKGEYLTTFDCEDLIYVHEPSLFRICMRVEGI
jgi:hypothetical protein